jgi:ferritin
MNLSENILLMLNNQWRHEQANSFRYFQRQNWADFYGYVGSAAYYKQEAEGERGHADKILEYINDRSALATFQPIDFDEPNNWKDLIDLFSTALEVERDTTARLTAIYVAAMAESDIMTVNLMAEMIEAQKDEENEYQLVLDRFAAYAPAPARNNDLDYFIKENFVK